MEKCAKSDNIVLLLDSYSLDSQNLHESLLLAGYDCQVIVLEENNFLPKGVMSVYDLLSGDTGMEEEKLGKPRFFNEIAVPDDWSISTEYEKTGKISYLHEEKGKIYYVEPARKYLVEAVEWYDRKGTVRFRDDYNRYGEICARTVFDAAGQPVNKSWLAANGQELLVKNCVTGDMILNDDDRVKCFRTMIDLVLYLLVRTGVEQSRIFINSLSMPFLISNQLNASIKSDILFWQESIGGAIPENMQTILNGQANRIDKIVVQRKSSYNRLLELGAKEDMVCVLGMIHSFKKENENRPEALICTNSERIEHCEELVRVLPQMHFHIAAITQMSPNLMRLETYDNVTLHPNIKENVLDKLFE